MPTIDELAPATAASDNDELPVSQSGITRKVTRAQVLTGLQPQLAISSGTLLGRISGGMGGPEQISIGANLSLTDGALSASATPFNIASLLAGTVPASSDLVPLAQGGGNAAVTYSQFMSGLAGIGNVDVSRASRDADRRHVADQTWRFRCEYLAVDWRYADRRADAGADPAMSLQAATKRYVDAQVARRCRRRVAPYRAPSSDCRSTTLAGGTKQYVDGQVAAEVRWRHAHRPALLAADPASSLQAATNVDTRVSRPGHTDRSAGARRQSDDNAAGCDKGICRYSGRQCLPKAGGTLTGRSLAADPASLLQAATKQYVDTRVSRAGDTLTGALVLAADPTTTLQAATKGYVDAQVAGALPKAGGTLTGVLTLAADPTLSMQAATKNYVDARAAISLPISGGTLTGPLSLPSNPASALQAAPKQYVDSQVAGALPLAGGTLTGALTLPGDPTTALQAATKRYVDSAGGAATGVINVRSAPYNAQLNGVTDDTAAFKAAYQAAVPGSAIYVPNGVTVLQTPSSWGIPVTKRVKWIVDGTSLPDGTPLSNAIPGGASPANNYLPGLVVGNSGISFEVSQNGSQPTDFAVSHSSYIVNHAGGPTGGGGVIANTRSDTIIYGSPTNYVWGGVDRLVWCGSQTPSGAPARGTRRALRADDPE